MNRNIKAITDFIFVEDTPQKSDVIMVVGGSYPEAAEIAADLWKSGYAPKIMIGGGVSKNNWYLSEYGRQRVLGELKRCGEQIKPDELERLIMAQS